MGGLEELSFINRFDLFFFIRRARGGKTLVEAEVNRRLSSELYRFRGISLSSNVVNADTVPNRTLCFGRFRGISSSYNVVKADTFPNFTLCFCLMRGRIGGKSQLRFIFRSAACTRHVVDL